MRKITIALLLATFLDLGAHAQDFVQSKVYPKNFFAYPLELPPSTAGSFGELRPNHFHSGLDFKTNQQTGYPVHAAYDGYVSRLRVQFGGFGNAVYITHPNGYTTVYGHLLRLAPELAELVHKAQYEQQSDLVDIVLTPLQKTVCKGDVFAWSGNTGASAGPHLHFEIRDTKTEETINPQLFGLTINDKVPPTISSIGIYHLDGNPFSEKTPKEFAGVVGASGSYRLAKPKVFELSGDIGFGIAANDMNSTSANHNGVFSIELKLDGKTVYTFAVERFAFDQTHAINAYIDYPAFLSLDRMMQKCFILPGSKISLYPQSINRGIIRFNDSAEHDVEYVVKDIAGNTSTLKIKVKSSPIKDTGPKPKPAGTLFKYDQRNEFNAANVKVIIPPGNLYDDLDFIYSVSPKPAGAFSAVHHIHNHFTPIHDSYEVWIKPDSNIGKYADKAVIVSTENGSEGGVYEDGYVKAHVRSFGNFYVKIDTVAPGIHPLNIHSGASMAAFKGINFRMSDNLSGIKSYSGKIDGKWVLFALDFKSKILSYIFDSSVAKGKHSLELTVTDNKNNVSQFTADFYR